MDAPAPKTVEDHWDFQRDTVNLMARQIAPIMARALLAHADTKKMGQILSEWDFSDHPDKAAPAVFHSVYREFALLVYSDELGKDLAQKHAQQLVFLAGAASENGARGQICLV